VSESYYIKTVPVKALEGNAHVEDANVDLDIPQTIACNLFSNL
jgi:hypothetical protein